MKKIYCFFLILVIIVSASSCSAIPEAENVIVKEEKIENGNNNYMSGGKLASVDDELYYIVNNHNNTDLFSNQYKAYIISDNKTTEMITDKNFTLDIGFNMFQFKDKIYTYNSNGELLMYDRVKEQFVETDDLFDGASYISDQVLINYVEDDKLRVTINGKEFFPDLNILKYCVFDNYLYVLDIHNGLYRYDLKDFKEDSEYLAFCLKSNGYCDTFMVLNDFVYYDSPLSYNDPENGLHRYSLNDKSDVIICKDDILSINTNGKTFYYLTDKALFSDNGEETVKMFDISANEIYVFGKDYIYLSQTNFYNSVLFRSTSTGKKLEKVFG